MPFSQVSAARDIISATLNGVSSASVKKSEMVNASVTVESKNLGNWASTMYKIGKAPWVCVDTANHKAGTTGTESFQMKAPGANGTYAVVFKAYGGNDCKQTHSSFAFTLVNGLLVNSVADTTPPDLSDPDLVDDTVAKKTKYWNWCASPDDDSTYRFIVDQNPIGKPTGAFSRKYCYTTVSEGNGVFYLHIEAKDNAGNMSSKTVSAVLDNVNNNAPTFPTEPLVEDKINPKEVTDPTPEFSVIFNDPDTGDMVKKYRLIIKGGDKSQWDSGVKEVPGYPIMETFSGQRLIIPVEYSGPALKSGVEYEWVIRLWDNADAAGKWSPEGAHFTFVGE